MELKLSAMAPRLAALFPAPRRRSIFRALWYFSFNLQRVDKLFGDDLAKANVVAAASPEPPMTTWESEEELGFNHLCHPIKKPEVLELVSEGGALTAAQAAVCGQLQGSLGAVPAVPCKLVFALLYATLSSCCHTAGVDEVRLQQHGRRMCAALLTNQVALSITAYLRSPGTKYATDKDSPQKYQGTNVGTPKQRRTTESL
ncbi:hypothetical protein EYF80_008920 [Liparis tanakae]|uniref:Uncharacterized protein n=1 Tax=Liparis tanakae TaxID=230148 RepID=A0A4Z2ISN8_9TELE|nr:hypothetical protein EYF80_008920 [Liparis tanakae]